MRDIAEEEIKSAFGNKTFSRGLDYFERGYVENAVKRGEKLHGTVLGSAPNPYKVTVEIAHDKIYSECTCPVGWMCKHGTALLLQWINDRASFTDVDDFLSSLQKKSKEEIIKMMGSIVERDPISAAKLSFQVEVSERKVNLDAISRRIGHVLRGFLDYYAVPGVVEELEEVKEMGDKLAEERHFEDAVDVYLLLIERGVDVFESGVDDSDGRLGSFVMDCVRDFNDSAEKLEEEQKDSLIHRIMDVVGKEDYGLETDEMLFRVATRENMPDIEEDLLGKIPAGEDFSAKHHRKRIIDLLTNLYGNLDLYEDAFRVIERAGLRDKGDYLRLAEALMKRDKGEEAFEQVKKGLKEGKGGNYTLDELYFKLLNQFLAEGKIKGEELEAEEPINVALDMISYFRQEIYERIKEVFKKIGRYDGLISNIKERSDGDVAISVLLHDGYINDAIELVMSSDKVRPTQIIEVAEVAKQKGKEEEAVKLTFQALKRGLISAEKPINELINLFVMKSEEEVLKEAIGYARNVSIARIFINALLSSSKSPEFAVWLLEKFASSMGKGEIKSYAVRLKGVGASEEALKICHEWVFNLINRSHVYYDDAVDVLGTMKGICDEDAWRAYISAFVEANKGKRKLMEKMREIKFIS